MSAPDSRFVRACKGMPVDRTPVWFMRQAGRYMPEYRAVRKQHSLIQICKNPQLAAEVTITAAEFLKVDAAIIFADLLLPVDVMGMQSHFSSGEGLVIESPVRRGNGSPITSKGNNRSAKMIAASTFRNSAAVMVTSA